MTTLRHATAVTGAVACLSAAAIVGVLTAAGPAAAATSNPKVPGFSTTSETSFLTPYQQLTNQSSASYATMSSVGLASGGGKLATTVLAFHLVLQTDGNLVEYVDGPNGTQQPVWSTGTTTATRLVFQTDHNVVLRDAAGLALWSTGTAGTTAQYFSVYGNGQIVTQDTAGRVISSVGPSITARPGVLVESATSPDGHFFLLRQEDGNLVEYARVGSGMSPVWSSRSHSLAATRLVVQQDGNLVLRETASGKVVWQSSSHGPVAYYQLDVQDDGNVVLYRTDGVHRLNAVWATYTKV